MTKTVPPVPMPPPTNPYEGHGGSYSLDPATGQTTLIERAGLQASAPTPPIATQPEATPE